MCCKMYILLSNLYSFMLDRTGRIRYLFIRKEMYIHIFPFDKL